MPSVIRLLPRKEIQRHVVPYAQILAMVFTKRFVMAARVLALFTLGLALCAKLLVAVPFLRLWLSFALTAAGCLIVFKAQLTAEPPAFLSVAAEVVHKLAARSTWATLLGFGVSAAVYFHGLLSASTPYYAVRKASYRPLPEGIPPSLALHRTDHWYIVNEKYQYAASFVAVLVVAQTVLFTAADANCLRLTAAESGLKPLDRLLRRARALHRPLMAWALCALAWPVIYFAAIRSTRWSPLQIAGTVTLSGFKVVYVLLPVLFLPLTLIWVATHETLMVYLSLGPVYKGKPLSEAVQTDQNGSLVDGVSRAPGTLSALTAWYELLVIAEHYEDRRKSIYSDADRDRVIWNQLHQKFVSLLGQKVAVLKPAEKTKLPVPYRAKTGRGARPSIVPLSHEQKTRERRLLVREKSEQLYKPESALEKKLSTFVHHLESESTSRANRAHAIWQHWRTRFLKLLVARREDFLATKLGAPFRKTVPRKLAVMLPHRQEIAFAARGIARMMTHSLKEDEKGYVQGTIASTLSVLDKLAHHLESLVTQAPIDASDVLVRRHAVEPDTTIASDLLAEMNSAFAEVAEAFGPYLKNFKIDKAVQARLARLAKNELNIADSAWVA